MRPAPPQILDISRLAKQGIELNGFFQVGQLPRLCEAVADESGQVDYRLAFGRDRGGFIQITGHYHADLTLTCQRCLQNMPVSLGADIRLAVVDSAEAARMLPAGFEPLQQDAAAPDLVLLIEDEVLLGLPFAPLHDANDCPLTVPAADKGQAARADDRQQPFAELDKLLRATNSNKQH